MKNMKNIKNTKKLIKIEVDLKESLCVSESTHSFFQHVPYLGVQYNLYFQDGICLYLWEDEDICPSGYERCVYTHWKWEKKTPQKRAIKSLDLEVLIEEDSESIKVYSSTDHKILLEASKFGEDAYYPSGYINFFLGRWGVNKNFVWLLRGLDDFEEEKKPVEDPEMEDLPLATQIDIHSSIKKLRLNSITEIPEEIQTDIIITKGGDMSFSDIAKHLKKEQKLLEVFFVNKKGF